MRKLALLLFLATSTFAVNAQNSWQGGIRLGMGNNMLISNKTFTGNSDSTTKFSFDYSAGISAGWFHNKRTYYSHKLKGVRFEAHYTSLNQTYTGKTTIQEQEVNFTAKKHLGYVSIPILFCVNPSSDHGFFFEIGPQFSALVMAKDVFTTDVRGAAFNFTTSDKSTYSPMTYQLAMNMGKIFNIGYRGALHIGLKSTYTFNQVIRSTTDKYQNMGFMLYTGYTIRARDHYN